MNPADLFAALSGVPRLEGARCVGHSELWDITDDSTVTEYTVDVCSRCPALAGCRDWLDSLTPAQRPVGVVAGRVVRRKPPRTRGVA